MVFEMNNTKTAPIVHVVVASVLGVLSAFISFAILIVFGAGAEHAIPARERSIEAQLLREIRLGMSGQTIPFGSFRGKTVCVIVDQNLDGLSEVRKKILKEEKYIKHLEYYSKYWFLSVFNGNNSETYKYLRETIPVTGSNVCAENGNLIVSVYQNDYAEVEFMFFDGGQ